MNGAISRISPEVAAFLQLGEMQRSGTQVEEKDSAKDPAGAPAVEQVNKSVTQPACSRDREPARAVSEPVKPEMVPDPPRKPTLADVIREIQDECEEAGKIFDQLVAGSLTEIDRLMEQIDADEKAGLLSEYWALPDISDYIDRLGSLSYQAVLQVHRLGLYAEVGRDIRDASSSQAYLEAEGTDGARRAAGVQRSQMYQRAAAIYYRVYKAAEDRLEKVDKKIMTLLAKQRRFEEEALRFNMTENALRATARKEREKAARKQNRQE